MRKVRSYPHRLLFVKRSTRTVGKLITMAIRLLTTAIRSTTWGRRLAVRRIGGRQPVGSGGKVANMTHRYFSVGPSWSSCSVSVLLSGRMLWNRSSASRTFCARRAVHRMLKTRAEPGSQKVRLRSTVNSQLFWLAPEEKSIVEYDGQKERPTQ